MKNVQATMWQVWNATMLAPGQDRNWAGLKKLTNALGGNITFESAVGKGTASLLKYRLSSNKKLNPHEDLLLA